MKPSALRDLSAIIVAFQSSTPTLGFSIFRLKSNTTSGLLQQLHVQAKDREVEEVEENLDVTLPGFPVISTMSLPLLSKMPSNPSPQVILDPGPGLVGEPPINAPWSSNAPSPVPSSSRLHSVAVTTATSEPSPPPISGTLETSASPIQSHVVPPRSPSDRSPISEVRKIPLSASHFASIVISNNNPPTATSTVDSSTDALMAANTRPKQKRKQHHNPVNENLLASSRSRKLSKRARGLGYDDSDEERQHPVGESSKRARVRNRRSRAK